MAEKKLNETIFLSASLVGATGTVETITASAALYALTASYAVNGGGGGPSVSASYATTASYASSAGGGTGVWTGSFLNTGPQTFISGTVYIVSGNGAALPSSSAILNVGGSGSLGSVLMALRTNSSGSVSPTFIDFETDEGLLAQINAIENRLNIFGAPGQTLALSSNGAFNTPALRFDLGQNSFFLSSIYVAGPTAYVTGGLQVTGSSNFFGPVTTSAGFSGSGVGISGIVSASYAITASNATNAINATTAQTASYGSGTFYAIAALSASYAITASNATNAINATIAQTASYGSGTFFAQAALSSSYAVTSSYATIAQNVLGSITSASYALTASYALNGGSGGGGSGTIFNSVAQSSVFTSFPFNATWGVTYYINPVSTASVEIDPSMRIKIDATSAVSASVSAHITSSGPSGSWLTVNYSTNETSWTPLTSLSLMNVGTSQSIYSPMPAGAQGQIILQLVTTNGDNATAAEIGNVALGLIQPAAATTVSSSYAITASYALNGGGGGPSVSSSYASTASIAQQVAVISGSGNFLTSSIIINPGFAGGYVLLNPNTSSLSVNLPTHSLGASYNIRHVGISGSLTVADTSNVTQSVILPGFYYTFIDDGLNWWSY